MVQWTSQVFHPFFQIKHIQENYQAIPRYSDRPWLSGKLLQRQHQAKPREDWQGLAKCEALTDTSSTTGVASLAAEP
jgi:hypothetical protein